MICTLKESKNIHRNLKEREQARQEEQEREKEQELEDSSLCEKIKFNITRKIVTPAKLFWKFDVLPVLWLLPTIIFRISVFCLISTLSSSLCMNKNGNDPSMFGLILPIILFFTLVAISWKLVGRSIHLRWTEALVNSFCTAVLPIYSDVFLLVSYTL